MTEGPLGRKLILFSLPLILTGILQQLYSWADALIVGNVEGDLALAAIGSAIIVPNMISLLIIGFVSGVSIYTAQLSGEGDTLRIWSLLRSMAIFWGIGMLLSGVVLTLCAPKILKLLHTAEDVYPQAINYLRVYLCGTSFVAIYNIYAAVLRGLGNSKVALQGGLISSCINILLDLLFVVILHWSVVGAALATVISQLEAAIFIVVYTHKKYRLPLRQMPTNPQDIRNALRLSSPLAIQSGIKSAGNLILQGFMNGFGSQIVTAVTTAYRIDTVILLPVMNLGIGISTAVAQNIGSGKTDRARAAFHIGARIMLILTLITTMAVLTGGSKMLGLFGLERETVELGAVFFRSMSLFYPVFGFSIVLKSSLDGYGSTALTSLVNVLALAIRILMSYKVGDKLGVIVFALAEATSWIAMMVIFIICYLHKTRRASVCEQ